VASVYFFVADPVAAAVGLEVAALAVGSTVVESSVAAYGEDGLVEFVAEGEKH